MGCTSEVAVLATGHQTVKWPAEGNVWLVSPGDRRSISTIQLKVELREEVPDLQTRLRVRCEAYLFDLFYFQRIPSQPFLKGPGVSARRLEFAALSLLRCWVLFAWLTHIIFLRAEAPSQGREALGIWFLSGDGYSRRRQI